MMPSGKAGFTTRTSTVMTPTIAPKIHLPVLVIDADTGSVAMNIMPKAKPPITRCQCQGTANIGLVSEPIALNNSAEATMPSMTPATIRHAAIFITSSTAPPSRMASVLVSPIEPCTVPRKALIQSMPALVTASTPPAAPSDSMVAPV